MKRWLAFLLCFVLLFPLFSSCGGGEERSKLSGEEAAKLLLADKNLSSQELPDVRDIFGMEGASVSEGAVQLLSRREEADRVIWEDFSATCDFNDFFQSYLVSLESDTRFAAELIDYAKKTLGGTGYWLYDSASQRDLLLTVEADGETLYSKNNYGYFLCRRSTDSSARDVYEISRREFASASSRDVYSRILYVPGQCYEFSLSADGQELFLSANRDRGYWTVACIAEMESRYDLMVLMDMEDAAFSFLSYVNDSGAVAPQAFTAISKNKTEDILSVNGNEFTFSFSAFEGIESAYALLADVSEDKSATVNSNLTLVTKTGVSIGPNGKFVGGAVEYVSGAASQRVLSETETVTEGKITLRFHGATMEERAVQWKAFLAEVGLTCKEDTDAILSKLFSARTQADGFFGYFRWNGQNISTLNGIAKASQEEWARFEATDALYASVKNSPRRIEDSNGSAWRGYRFSAPQGVQYGAIALQNNTVYVEEIKVSLSDLSLLDQGTRYTVRLALAKVEENGALSNSVLLESGDLRMTTFESGPIFTVIQSATFSVPDCRVEGEYTLVAYVATESGIRVTEAFPVVFSQSVSEERSYPGMDVAQSLKTGNELQILCRPNADITVTPEEGKDSYTYEEVYQLLYREAMQYGAPVEGAVVEIYDFAAGTSAPAPQDAPIFASVCRLPYTKEMGGESQSGYVYLPLVSEMEQEIFRLLNEARATAQAPALKYNPLLYTCAVIRSLEAVELWSHTRPSGGEYWTVLEEKGIAYVAVNENLCRKFTSVGEVVETLLATESYKNVILDGKYTDSAVAVRQNAEGEYYLCQIFMTPLTYS